MNTIAVRTRASYAGLNPPPAAKHVVWSIAAIGASFVGGGTLGLVLLLAARGLGADSAGSASLGVLVGGSLAGAGVLLLGLMGQCRWTWQELGFVRPRHSLWHLIWWAPATVLIAGSVAMWLESFGIDTGEQGDIESFGLGTPAIIASVVALGVVGPFVEEIVFRRVVLDWLIRFMPPWAAVLLTTTAFALAHIDPTVMAYIGLSGLSFGIARLWFRSLTATFILHMVNNLLVAVVLLGWI